MMWSNDMGNRTIKGAPRYAQTSIGFGERTTHWHISLINTIAISYCSGNN